MEIEKRPIEAVIPYASNPRRNQAAVSKVAASIKEFGFRQPIVVDSGGVIIAGHTRLQAAQTLGLSEVPVHVADNLNPQQVKAYRIADNRTSEESEWDMELLALELDALKAEGCALEPLGFEDAELDSMLGQSVEVEGLTDPDEVPEVEEPFLRSGDLLELGGHRLLCGDSTKGEDVERLMDGKKADMVFTDPPYGVDYDGGIQFTNEGIKTGQRAKIKNDDLSIYLDVIPMMARFTEGAIYTWFADTRAKDIYTAIYEVGVIHAMLIWVKNGGYGAMNAHYKEKHEPCLYWKPKGKAMKWCGETTENTIWEIDKVGINKLHPTQKPVALGVKAISNHNAKSVLDLFLGSGSTLIACGKTARKCYGMEIDPHYCDVIVERWAAFTGQDELILNGNPLVWSQRGPRGSNV